MVYSYNQYITVNCTLRDSHELLECWCLEAYPGFSPNDWGRTVSYRLGVFVQRGRPCRYGVLGYYPRKFLGLHFYEILGILKHFGELES